MALHEDQAPASARPWHQLPPSLSALLSDAIPAIAGEVVDVMAASIPEYRVPDPHFARDVRRGVEGSLEDFAAVIRHRRTAPGASRAHYARLGQREWRSGRSLDALHAAYHLGARVVWRRISGLATGAGADPATVSLLADSVFAYLDEVAAVSADGFAAASAAAAGQTERHRQRLVAALLDGHHADARTLESLARNAAWALPRTVAVVAIGDPDDNVTARRLPPDVLVGVADGIGCVVVPDPDGPGRRGQLEYALADAGGPAVLGPTLPLEQAARSWTRARAVYRLACDVRFGADEARAGEVDARAGEVDAGTARAGAGGARRGPAHGGLAGRGLHLADDHLTTLLLAGEPELVADLARRRLAALDAQPGRSQERLEATLLAYLRHRGNGPSMAADLGVHPQTVRYRIARLRELLAEALDDPEARFELEVVLRSRASAARHSPAASR